MLTGSPGDDQSTANWTGDRALSPGGRSFNDFIYRAGDTRITGDTQGGTDNYAQYANKRADGGHKHPKYNYSNTSDGQFTVSTYAIGAYNIPSINGIIQDNAASEGASAHQHRVYGKTWNFPYGTPDDTSWAKPPPAINEDTAPVWYAVNYIIKI